MSETIESTRDVIPRYVPSQIICKMVLVPVTSVVFHPNGSDDSPLIKGIPCIEVRTERGSRWFGCDHAYINSELRMVVVGHDSRDEVRNSWKKCKVR